MKPKTKENIHNFSFAALVPCILAELEGMVMDMWV